MYFFLSNLALTDIFYYLLQSQRWLWTFRLRIKLSHLWTASLKWLFV
jgi:hypothetical protein